MNHKNISLSLLLAIALGFSACGGGGATPLDERGGEENKSVDVTPPAFSQNLQTSFTMPEEEKQDVVTIEVMDENPVTFSLAGKDAAFFELTDTKVRSVYSTTLRFKNLPDYEVQSSYSVAVIATDSAGNSSQKTFHVYLGDKPFAFNVAGNLGAIEENTTKRIALSTVEAKGNVTYALQAGSDDAFELDGDVLVFKAPFYDLTDASKNNYEATVTANDGQRTIELHVTAQVIKEGGKPVLKTFYLKHKEVIDGNIKTVYDYEYDAEHYLSKITKSGTNVYGNEDLVFDYEDDHKIMKEYTPAGLDAIRVFADKHSGRIKFPAMISTRLSMDGTTVFMSEIEDTPAFLKNRHLVKYIHGLRFHQTLAEVYAYNYDDSLNRIMTGKFVKNADVVKTMSAQELESVVEPSGGFPDGSQKLTSAQLQALKTGVLPFEISYETAFVYSNGKLTGRNFFGYYEDAEDKYFPVTVKYFTNNAVHEIESDNVRITYNTEGLLASVNSFQYNYTYSDNGLTVHVYVKNGDQTVTSYIFEEE